MLSVAIVTYHTPVTVLKRCFDSLSSSVIRDVTVVDNSNDKEIEGFCNTALCEFDIRYIASENIGYGAAHNKAFGFSVSKYHLVLNPDVRFEPSVLSEILDFMERHPNVGIAQPQLLNADGSRQYAARLLPSPIDVFGRRFLPRTVMKNRNNRYLLKHLNLDCALNVPYLQGSFMLFRTSVFNEIGGFDERFFLYPEDIDITRRIHRKYGTMYLPMWKVTHNHGRESYKSVRMMWIHCVNMIKYFNKWGWFSDAERKIFNQRLMQQKKEESGA